MSFDAHSDMFGPGFKYSAFCLCRTWISQVSGRFWRSMIRFWKHHGGQTGGLCMLKWLHFIPAKRSPSSYPRPRYMPHILVLCFVVVVVVALAHNNKNKTMRLFWDGLISVSGAGHNWAGRWWQTAGHEKAQSSSIRSCTGCTCK